MIKHIKAGIVMKLFYIIIKEIKECSRDLRTLLILFIMPLLLTGILAVTFKDKLSNHIDLSNIKVFYTLNCNENEASIINEYLSLLQSLGIETREGNLLNSSGVALEIDSLSDIKLIYTSQFKSQGKIIYSLLHTFLNQYSVLQEILPGNDLSPNTLEKLQQYNYVAEKSLENLKTPSSKDYYGIVMITLSFMFSSIIGAYKIMGERNGGTLTKLYFAPVSKGSILVGKLIGTSLFLCLEGSFIVLISNKFIGVYMGNNLLPILLTIFSQIIFAVSLGIFIGYVIKDPQSALLFLVIIVIIMGFLGGAFVPLSSLNSEFIYKTSVLSPLTQVNNSIFNYIYNENIIMVYNTCLLNLVISAILLLTTAAAMEVKK